MDQPPPKYSKTAFSSLIIESLDTIRCTDFEDYQSIDGYPYQTQSGTITNGQDTFQFIYPLVMTGTNASTLLLPTTSGTDSLKGFGTHPVCTQVVLGLTLSGSATNGTVVSGSLNNAPVAPGTVINLMMSGTIQPTIYFQLFYPNIMLIPPCTGFTVGMDHIENLGLQTGTSGSWPFTTPPAASTDNNVQVTTGAGNAPVTSMQIAPLSLPPCPYSSGTYFNGTITVGGQTLTGSFPLVSSTMAIGSGSSATFTFYDPKGYAKPVQNITVTFPKTTIPEPSQAGGEVRSVREHLLRPRNGM